MRKIIQYITDDSISKEQLKIYQIGICGPQGTQVKFNNSDTIVLGPSGIYQIPEEYGIVINSFVVVSGIKGKTVIIDTLQE